LADHVEKNSLQGKLKYDLFVGASSGAETENRWASLDMINRRTPHQVGKQIAKGINEGRIKFFDKHLSMFPSDLVYVSSSMLEKQAWSFMSIATSDISSRVTIPRTGQTIN
jgi:acetyl-CoA hydrolase